MGPDVAVLDGFTFTIDHKEIFPMRKTNKLRVAMGKVIALADQDPELKKLVKQLAPGLHKLASHQMVMDAEELKAEEKKDDEDDDLAKAAKDAEEEEKKKKDEEEGGRKANEKLEAERDKKKKDEEEGGRKANEKLDEERKTGMDAKEVQRLVADAVAKALANVPHAMDEKELLVQVNQRNKLAEQLSHFIGTFDASEMTHQEVAEYGVKKLGIPAQRGGELAVLQGYLHGRTPSKPIGTMDSGEKPTFLQAYLAPTK
jgi:hypothetical protein